MVNGEMQPCASDNASDGRGGRGGVLVAIRVVVVVIMVMILPLGAPHAPPLDEVAARRRPPHGGRGTWRERCAHLRRRPSAGVSLNLKLIKIN
jgi:hypothetical protein